MKILVKNHLKEPITVSPGNHIQVRHTRNEETRVAAGIKVTKPDTFNVEEN